MKKKILVMLLCLNSTIVCNEVISDETQADSHHQRVAQAMCQLYTSDMQTFKHLTHQRTKAAAQAAVQEIVGFAHYANEHLTVKDKQELVGALELAKEAISSDEAIEKNVSPSFVTSLFDTYLTLHKPCLPYLKHISAIRGQAYQQMTQDERKEHAQQWTEFKKETARVYFNELHKGMSYAQSILKVDAL